MLIHKIDFILLLLLMSCRSLEFFCRLMFVSLEHAGPCEAAHITAVCHVTSC